MAVQKELWQSVIVEGLFANNSFMSKSVNDDMYVNAKKVHIPNSGTPSNVEIDRSTVPAKPKKRADNDVEYTLNELTTDPIYIPNAEMVELSYDKRNSVIAEDRQILIEHASQQMLYNWAPDSANTVETSGDAVNAHTPSATGNRKALTKNDVLNLMVLMNKNNVPKEGRYLLLDSVMYAQLLSDLAETDKFAFLQGVDAERGIVGKLYGFEIMERSQVLLYNNSKTLKKWSEDGTTDDNAAGLAWQERCVSRALGEVKMFSDEDSPTYYGDVYSFLVRVGGARRRYDNKGVYAILQAASV